MKYQGYGIEQQELAGTWFAVYVVEVVVVEIRLAHLVPTPSCVAVVPVAIIVQSPPAAF